MQAELGTQIETDLVALASQFDPRGLQVCAQRIHDHYDPDGLLKDGDYRERHRSLDTTRGCDGAGTITGRTTGELAEHLDILFTALAAPKPEVDGVKNGRSAGQRRHDAMLQTLKMLIGSDLLPSARGVPATVVIHLSDDAWRTGQGTATTGHGAIVPAGEAIRWAGGDVQLLAVAIDHLGQVTAHSGLHRLFRRAQRLAIAARDLGCTFPGCTEPAPRCQLHHITDWAGSHRTTIDNGALVCDYHHREQIRQGWTTSMIDNRPAWTPPSWFDPEQTPRFNRAHEPWRRQPAHA